MWPWWCADPRGPRRRAAANRLRCPGPVSARLPHVRPGRPSGSHMPHVSHRYMYVPLHSDCSVMPLAEKPRHSSRHGMRLFVVAWCCRLQSRPRPLWWMTAGRSKGSVPTAISTCPAIGARAMVTLQSCGRVRRFSSLRYIYAHPYVHDDCPLCLGLATWRATAAARCNAATASNRVRLGLAVLRCTGTPECLIHTLSNAYTTLQAIARPTAPTLPSVATVTTRVRLLFA